MGSIHPSLFNGALGIVGSGFAVILGDLVWLGMLFITGIALGEVLKIWKDSPMLVRLADAFGLSLPFNILVLMPLSQRGVTMFPIIAIYSTSLLLLALSVTKRQRFDFWVKPKLGKSRAMVFIFASMLAIILMQFSKAPYFPSETLPSIDFIAHVRNVNAMLSSAPPLRGQILYWGVYYALAPLVLLDGGQALFLVRYGMAALTLLSLLLVYRCAFSVFNDSNAAILVSAIYGLGAFVWFVAVFDIGLFANFYGLALASTFLISMTVSFFKQRANVSGIILLLLAFFGALFSHYSTLLVFPALLIYAAMHFGKSLRLNAEIYLATVLAPVIGVAIFFRGILLNLLSFTEGTAGIPPAPTWLSWVFLDPRTRALTVAPSGLPNFNIPLTGLSYMVALISNDYAAFLLLSLVIPYVYVVFRSKQKPLLIPLISFAIILIAAPFNVSAWRFSFVALMPLTFMAGAGLLSIIPFESIRKKLSRVDYAPTMKGFGILGCLMWLLVMPIPYLSVGSWGSISAGRSINTPDVIPQDQSKIVQTIAWMKSHLPKNDSLVSVAEWRFRLSQDMGGQVVYNAPDDNVAWGDPNQVQIYASAHNAYFLIVTKYLSETKVPYANLTLIVGKNYTQVVSKVDAQITKLNSSIRYGLLNAFPIRYNGTDYSQQIAVFFFPWYSYTNATLPMSNVVYEIPGFVRVICIAQACHDMPKVVDS